MTPIYDGLCVQYLLSDWAGLWHVEDPFCAAWDELCGALGEWARPLPKLPNPFAVD
jgi:hypothetical protein